MASLGKCTAAASNGGTKTRRHRKAKAGFKQVRLGPVPAEYGVLAAVFLVRNMLFQVPIRWEGNGAGRRNVSTVGSLRRCLIPAGKWWV